MEQRAEVEASEEPASPGEFGSTAAFGGGSAGGGELIGREALVRQAAALLAAPTVRLLTLTGPGGIGKTTLARAAAAFAGDGFLDGVVVAELAAEREPSRLLAAVVEALGLEVEGDELPLATLTRGLDGRRLLMLDNLEQLLPGAEAIGDLLRTCPDLTILATSRTRLGLPGERELAVPPLALPDGAARPLEEVAASAAVELFVRRARQANPVFVLSAGNVATVAEVCRRLDGLPLALELGAARLRLLSPEALLARLDARLDVLTGGPRDAPERHRTIRDTVAWSVDLLRPEERRVFTYLAVFAGGCTVDDLAAVAEAIEAEAGRRASDVSMAVAALVDGSLLATDDDAKGGPRLVVLESVRDVASEMLADGGAIDQVRAAHAERYRHVAERDGPGLRSDHATQSRIVYGFADELGNLRAALAWFVERGDATGGLRLAAGMDWFWMVSRPVMAEGVDWIDRLLAVPAEDPPVPRRFLGEVHRVKALLLDWLGPPEAAERAAEVAAAALADSGAHVSRVEVLLIAASSALDRGDLTLARDRYERLLVHAERHRDALPATTEIDLLTAKAGLNLALVLVLQSEPAAAVDRATEAMDRYRGVGGLEVWMRSAQHTLALAHLGAGDTDAAARALLDAVDRSRPVPGNDATAQFLPLILPAVAHLAARRRDAAVAARLFAAGDALKRDSVPIRPPLQARIDADVDALRIEMGESRFAAEWAVGAGGDVAAWLDLAEAFLRDVISPVLTGRLTALSPRQLEVLRLLQDGASDREIADRLFIARRTASDHVSSILATLGQRSRTAAATYAAANGLRAETRAPSYPESSG